MINKECIVIEKDPTVILLTKLNNSPVVVNIDNIKYIESVPDTIVTFLNGETVIVKENLNSIIQKSAELRANAIKLAHDEGPQSLKKELF